MTWKTEQYEGAERMNELQVSRIEVVDAQGRPRIILGMDADGHPSVAIHDVHGAPRLSLGLAEGDAATIRVAGSDNGPAAELAATPDGFAGLTLMRKNGEPLAILEVEAGPDARPYLGMFHPGEEIPRESDVTPRWRPSPLMYLTATEEGNAYLQFLAPNGDYLESLPAPIPVGPRG